MAQSFLDGCARVAVRDEDRDALWELHCRWKRKTDDAERQLAELFDDYEHWKLYLQSREGNAAAARKFERYWRRYIGALASDRLLPEQVDEVISAFFERSYRFIGTCYAWNCPFSTYLRTIVLNLIRDLLTRIGKRREREVSMGDDQVDRTVRRVPTREASPEQSAIDAETRATVLAAIESLSPLDHHIVRVCLIEGGSGQELAEELSMSRDALYQRLRRARLKLKKTLAGVYDSQIKNVRESRVNDA